MSQAGGVQWSGDIAHTQEVEAREPYRWRCAIATGRKPAAPSALAAALADKRPVHFEAHGKFPRRVCDLAYDELYLKLRQDPKFGLDPSPKMKGVIREATPVPERDKLIKALAARMPAPGGPLLGCGDGGETNAQPGCRTSAVGQARVRKDFAVAALMLGAPPCPARGRWEVR